MAHVPEEGQLHLSCPAWPPKKHLEEVPIGAGGPIDEIPVIGIEHFGFRKYVKLFEDAALTREAIYELGTGDTRATRKDGSERRDFVGCECCSIPAAITPSPPTAPPPPRR